MEQDTALAASDPQPLAAGGEAMAFEAAGRRVWRRVLLRRWLAGLRKGLWPLLVVLLAAVIWAARGGGAVAVTLAWLAPVLLMAVVAAQVWRRRPSVYAALALWDRQAERREAFAAAWWFEGLPHRTAAETAHWDKQRQELPAALERLGGDLPLPRWRSLLALPVLAVLAAVASQWGQARLRGPELTAEMVDVAVAQAREVERLTKQAEAMEGLSAEDQERLRQQMREAAAALKNSEGKTARELLDELESKARETEKLAQRLGAGDEAWASQELTEALRRQADTADLGDAVADRDASAAAAAAESLAGQLDEAETAQAERLQEVFTEAGRAAQAEDAERPVGEAVAAGASALQEQRAQDASAAMRELARQMQELAGRRQTREEMERLAQQLRDAGSRVAGAEAGQGMEALSASGEAQTGQGEGAIANGAGSQSQAAQPGAGELAMPSGEGQQGGEGAVSPQQTMPGAEGPQMALAPRDPNAGQGDGKPNADTPMLLAPVPPGGEPDQPPEMAMLLPGGPPGGASMAVGGSALPPGAGKAELKPGEGTEADPSAKQSLVNARRTQEGASALRQVEGGAPRAEAARSAAPELTVEFLQAQEAALGDSALPHSRREQVRRYFNALRQRLEGER